VLDRIVRNAALVCAVVAVIYALAHRSWLAGLSVMGGGLLIGISYWAIRGAVDAATARGESGETPLPSTRLQLVKFFTRHVILALAAYGMMVRLHLDPLGVLAGVSSLVIGVAVEVLRDLRWRRFP
jgi:hypothetical protein